MTDDNVLPLFSPTEPEYPDDEALTAVLALDEVADAAEAVVGGALDLKRYARSEYGAVRAAAETAMSVARDSLNPAVAGDPSYVDSPTFRRGRRLDERMLDVRRRMQICRPIARVQRTWMVLGVLVTCAAAWLIVQQHWLWAATLIAARLVISVRYGDEHNLPFEGRSSGTRASTIVYRCLAGHISDSVILVAIVWVLVASDRPLWAVATVGAIAVMLLATLLRVAALQVGAQIYRLTLERIVRCGSVLVALLASGIAQPELPAHGPLWLGIAIAGPLLYGFGETMRVGLRLRQTDVISGGSLPQVSITVADPHGRRRLPSDVDRLRRRQAPGGAFDRDASSHAI